MRDFIGNPYEAEFEDDSDANELDVIDGNILIQTVPNIFGLLPDIDLLDTEDQNDLDGIFTFNADEEDDDNDEEYIPDRDDAHDSDDYFYDETSDPEDEDDDVNFSSENVIFGVDSDNDSEDLDYASFPTREDTTPTQSLDTQKPSDSTNPESNSSSTESEQPSEPS